MTADITTVRPTASECSLQIDFQPIVQLIFSNTTAYDACVALITDELGRVSYKVLSPLAERTDMNVQLEQWIFKKSCRKAQEMIRNNSGFEYISINVSARYLKMESYISDLLEILKEIGIPPEIICLEILERDLEAQADDIIDKLHELKREGFMVAIDDYSATYMPLSRLDSVPADIIKLDKSVTSRIVVDRKAEENTVAIIQRAKSLKCEVIAKAVDNQKLRYLLMALGCEKIQGYVEKTKIIDPRSPLQTEGIDVPQVASEDFFNETL